MLKKLLEFMFGKKAEPKDVKVFDFTSRGAGHDITLRVIGDGDYAEGMVFLCLGEEGPSVGDFIVVDLEPSAEDELDNVWTFVVDSAKAISLNVHQITMSRYEGMINE